MKKNFKNRIFLNLSKLFYAIFLLYYGWFQKVFYVIPQMSIIVGLGILGFIILDFLINRTQINKAVTSEIIVWFIFAMTSLSTGIFVAYNIGEMINAISTFMQCLIIIFSMVYISLQDKKIDYFINIYILFCIICSFTTLFRGVYVFSGRFSMSYSTNPNALAISMVIGVFCILYKLNFQYRIRSIVQLSEMLLFFYILLLTGSRKALFSYIFIIFFWSIFVPKKFSLKKNRKISLQSVSLTIIIGAIVIIIAKSSNLEIINRIKNLLDNSGDDVRREMYIVAFDLFKQHPFIGIGFNNYRYVTRFFTYSHSTYAEVISCTGIIGTILYFIPYIIQIKKVLKLTQNKDINIKKNAKLLIGLIGILIFLATGIIHFYDIDSSIAFGFIISFCALNYKYYSSLRSS